MSASRGVRVGDMTWLHCQWGGTRVAHWDNHQNKLSLGCWTFLEDLDYWWSQAFIKPSFKLLCFLFSCTTKSESCFVMGRILSNIAMTIVCNTGMWLPDAPLESNLWLRLRGSDVRAELYQCYQNTPALTPDCWVLTESMWFSGVLYCANLNILQQRLTSTLACLILIGYNTNFKILRFLI